MSTRSNTRKFIYTGFIVVSVLLASYWGFNFLKGNDLFDRQNTYHIIYNRIDGLTVSSPVTVNGFKIGQVSEIKLMHDANAQILVTIQLRGEHQLPTTANAKIYSMDLMGTKGIEVDLGASRLMHNENDTLKGEVEQSLKDQVNMQMLPIKKRAEDLMKEMEEVITTISLIFNEETRANLRESFASIKRTVAHIESSSGSLDSLMVEQRSRISNILTYVESITFNLTENGDHISNILSNLSSFSDSIASVQLSHTLRLAHEAVEDFADISDRINRGEGSIGMLINSDSLYLQLESASMNLDRLLLDIRMNPEHYINLKLLNFRKDVKVVDESMLSESEKKILDKKRERIEKQNRGEFEEE